MSRNDVLITGVGLVTPIGNSLGEVGLALSSGWKAFDTVGSGPMRAAGARALPAWDRSIGHQDRERMDRSVQLAIVAADRALRDAGWTEPGSVPTRCGLYVGSACGPTASLDAACVALFDRGRLPGLTLLRCLPCGAGAAIALRHGMTGPNQFYSSACASSAMAIGEAMRAIRHGYVDVALAGGTEAPFSTAALAAWEGMRLLAPPGRDPNKAYRPFDADRSGMLLGEGAAFFVLESLAHARARGQRARASLRGYGSCSGGDQGMLGSAIGKARAMREALEDARMQRGQIGGVHAQGVGTEQEDLTEAQAIAMVFGDARDAPPVFASKSTHGHLLGASGAVELAVSLIAIGRSELPPTRNLVRPDTRCAINHVIGDPRPISPNTALVCNSFGIGGANVSLVLGTALD